MRRIAFGVCLAMACMPARGALAWGVTGHEIIGHIAYGLLSPTAKARADAILAGDADTVTTPDFAARAAWADQYRNVGDKKVHYAQTHLWFFTDLELSKPDLDQACHGFLALPAEIPASAGPADACLTDKLMQFERELGAHDTAPAERIMALKYVMNFVGDIHQPFHVSDNQDSHGNCVQVRTVPKSAPEELHHVWDDVAVDDLVAADQAKHPGADLAAMSQRLADAITPAQAAAWRSGDARQWTLEAYKVAKTVAYDLPPHPVCTPGMNWARYRPFMLPASYQARTIRAVRRQLQQAGVRLAWVLNQTLA